MATVTRASAKLQSEELKDAYRGWLKDLYDDKPEKLLRKLGKKKKNGGGRRARQIQRLQHAQQHTAASALKDVALKKAERAKLPALSLLRYTPVDKQALHESQNRRHQALVDEANYSSFQYAHHPSWRPGLAFFQQLVRFVLQKVSPGIDNDSDVSGGVVSAELAGFPLPVAPVLLRIPVRRHRLAVALLFCQEHNQEQEQEHDVSDGTASFVLHCRLYSRASDWREHRNALLDIVSNPSTEVCAVRKCAEDFESRSNEIKSLRSRQEVGEAMDELWVDYSDTDTSPNVDTDLFAIQRYIPFKGVSSNAFATGLAAPAERKAWVARCASRKRDKKSSTIWIITGGDSTDSTTTNSTSTDCQLVKCNIDQAWPEPRLLTSMCAISLEKALRIRFNELVLDLLQDMMGNWWLLQVKAFTLGAVRPTSANASSASLLSKKSSRGLSRTLSAPNQFGAGMIPTPQWKKWRCAGRYCTKISEESFSEPQIDEDVHNTGDDKEPSGYLTKKVLRSCEFYDDFVRQQDMSLAGGFTEFHSALSFHLQHRLPKRDRSQLYESQPLCSACLRRYHTLRQQWIETVETPKVTPNPRSNAKHSKKATLSNSLDHDQANRILLHPRKLPSLHYESAISLELGLHVSTLDAQTKTASKHEDGTTTCVVTKALSYLDELAAMEEILAAHEPPSLSTKAKSDIQYSDRRQRDMTATAAFVSSSSIKENPDGIFPKWDGVTRIEAMWQNLTLKPIERQLTDPGLDIDVTIATKQGYNSISLQQELAKAVEGVDNNGGSGHHQMTPEQTTGPTIDLLNEKPSPVRQKPVAAHTVHVEHCRQVFEDEIYREELVNNAISALRSGKSNICFVVTPHTHSKQYPGEDEDELAEMALRSLYLDVKQAAASSTEAFTFALSLSSWPMRPQISREASGRIMVKLGRV